MKDRASPEGSDTELLANGHHVIVLSDGGSLGGNLGVHAALSTPQKWAFLASNLPYAIVSYQIFAAARIREVAVWEPLTDGCASPLVHGLIIAGLCVVSTVWHAAQCQFGSLLCGAAPFLPTALRRLLVADVLCSLIAVCVGLVCFRGRTLAWLALPSVAFLQGRRCKQQSLFARYAVWHSLWHCLSAVAIWNIVLWPVGL